MAIELKVPAIGESITEVEIAEWMKKPGDPIRKDEAVAMLDSEKATVELPAPESGTLSKILKKRGEVAKVGEVIGYMETSTVSPVSSAKPIESTPAVTATQPPPPPPPALEGKKPETITPRVMPAAERAMAALGIRVDQVSGTGPGGRVLKEDVLRAANTTPPAEQTPEAPAPTPDAQAGAQTPELPPSPPVLERAPGREEETVPMSLLRRTVAERLVHAQQTAALLTTFNEVDVSAINALRQECGEAFLKKHEVKLGFMSFFVKACVDALKQFPPLNAEIRGTSIVFRNYYDIGVAIGGGKGLVVPVLRSAEHLSFAEIELRIADLARRAKQNQLKVEELQGGTFTISNGGVYGSLLSTPIVNPPQSGVLGMHTIQERPVARDGAVVIRPMMYLALTYDHRIVDGREAVSFLKRIKDVIENPARMLIEI